MNNTYKTSAVLILITILAVSNSALAQNSSVEPAITSVSLDECYVWSRENYPLIKQMVLIDKSTQYTLSNASVGNLPQISLNGQASYQSDVTALPIDIPNIETPVIDKDQYKIYGEIYQPLSNYSNVNANKKLINKTTEIEKQKLELDLYHLKDRINQIYFGTLLINKKIEQFEIIQSDLDSTLVKIAAGINNGTATITDKQILEVERISLDQKIEEKKANQKAFLKMLSALTGKNIQVSTELQKPIVLTLSTTVNRPELLLFNLQSQALDLQGDVLKTTLRPNLGLFAQGGYGRPALNFLSNEFDLYYIGGIKLNWNISSLYTYKNKKRTLELSNDIISAQQETFLLNTKLSQYQQSAEILKYESLINSDTEIIKIREAVLETANVQLNNGLITTIDYVKFLNDINNARQLRLLHETQLLLSQFNLKMTSGN